MAFLDNSGDIILDAVLTDTGRMRLAKGDGSFRIVKFALGDDEIDYSLFNKDHASGSAYFDLAVMQTPVLEAFTNNASSMKNKLISFSRTDLLYLPVIRINEIADANKTVQSAAAVDGTGTHVVKELTRLESSQTADAGEIDSPIKGSRGTKIEFKIKASADLETSSFLFTQLGGGSTITINSQLYYYIDSNIRITGATTGYSVNAPVRFLKHKGAA
jgi:hypothetical protein